MAWAVATAWQSWPQLVSTTLQHMLAAVQMLTPQLLMAQLLQVRYAAIKLFVAQQSAVFVSVLGIILAQLCKSVVTSESCQLSCVQLDKRSAEQSRSTMLIILSMTLASRMLGTLCKVCHLCAGHWHQQVTAQGCSSSDAWHGR